MKRIFDNIDLPMAILTILAAIFFVDALLGAF